MVWPKMMNKKGSASVFLVYIISAMVALAALFVYAAKIKAYTGICDGVLNLAQRSVLSEYDLTLYERYGLMAFEKNGMEAALEIDGYIDYSFKKDAPAKKTQVTFGDYSMGNVNTLKKQIIEYMELYAVKDLISAENNNKEREEWEDRILRNKGITETLPSKPFRESGEGFLDKIEQLKDQIKSADEILNNTTDTYLMDKYILTHFKHAAGGPLTETSFFDHEVEYILIGDFSNKKNRETVEKAVKLIRTAMNTAYLYTDEKRYAQTLAAAELMTPASAPATQAVIITTWAAAEAENDLKLLLKCKPVPFNKTDGSWATSLDNVLNNITDGCIDPGVSKGMFYDDYMMLLLHFQNEEVKLARIADLIQINMKAVQDRDFLMNTAYAGMITSTQIYGKEYSYETCY